MNKYLLISFLLAFFYLPLFLFADLLPEILDTVLTESSLQGVISYYPVIGIYNGGTTAYGDYILYVGDVYDQWYYGYGSSRAYLSFQVQTIPDNYMIDSVSIYINQHNCVNNLSGGVFPYWDTDPPAYYPCNLYHVNYGSTLEPVDFNPEAYGLIGAISTNNLNDWKQLDITDAYQQDLSQNREYCQFMIKFDILSDYDYATDGIEFDSSYTPNIPHLVIHYSSTTGNYSDNSQSFPFLSINPNPCNDILTITTIKDALLKSFELYNIKGQRVLSDYTPRKTSGVYQYKIDHRKLIPGVYVIKCNLQKGSHTLISTNKLLIQ